LEFPHGDPHAAKARGETIMRSCLLVLLGIPLPVVFLLWFVTGHL